LSGAEKAQIREALHAIQGQRCAYCERRTGPGKNDGHIEHFRCQAGHDALALDWTNLFWSCNDETTCGKFKDKCTGAQGLRARFDPTVLLDPSIDDPDDYFLFVVDGSVKVRDGLDELGRQRAIETLRVFNLSDSAFLRKAREDAVQPFVGIVTMLMKIAPDTLADYISSEMARSADLPFSAPIRHFLYDQA
jgi:uncharacterized protein (TIGR02646 family)